MVHDCTVTPSGGGWAIALASPARGVAPGQAAVLYDGDQVLGSATVAETAA
jgi:tRNA-specific 2-thiouridylase